MKWEWKTMHIENKANQFALAWTGLHYVDGLRTQDEAEVRSRYPGKINTNIEVDG